MKKVVIIAIAAMFAGCVQDMSADKTVNSGDKFKSMVVSSSFDWKMTADVNFNITADQASLVTVSAAGDSTPLAVFVAGGDAEQVSLSLPAALASVNVSYENTSGTTVSTTLPVSADMSLNALDAAAMSNGLGNDNESVGHIYYPGESRWGTLMFEDLWPGYGDYDFNDMVVNYNIDLDMHNQNKIDMMTVNLRVKAVGGTLSNDFYVSLLGVKGGEIDEQKGGVQLLSSTNAKDQVAVTFLNTRNDNLNPAVVRVSGIRKNVNNTHSTYVNTKKGYELSADQYVTVSFKVWFRNSIATSDLSLEKFDFFIARETGGSLHEIHEGGKTPSIYGQSAYAAAVASKKNSARELYYSVDNLVWAINVPMDIAHGYETVDFLNAYPQMKTWAQSGGYSAKDWYLNGVSEYFVKK